MDRIAKQHGLNWCWYRGPTLHVHDERLIAGIQSVFRDGFAIQKDWKPESIRKYLHVAHVVGLLTEADGSLGGYAIYSCSKKPLYGRFVLWEDSICVRKSFQRRGIVPSPHDLVEKLGDILGRKVGWIGGNTQNPAVFRRYQALGKILPIDIPFSSMHGKRVMQFLLEWVPQVEQRRKDLDINTGVLREIYAQGKLGNYRVGIRGAERFEQYLARHGIRRECGDSLLLVTKIQAPN